MEFNISNYLEHMLYIILQWLKIKQQLNKHYKKLGQITMQTNNFSIHKTLFRKYLEKKSTIF